MAADPADVLIIGAGASGARRGPAAGPGRLQGRVPRAGRVDGPGRLPGQQARLGAEGPQGLGDEPQHPRPRARLPDRRGRHPRLAAHVQRGRRLDDHLRRCLAARPAVGLPGPLARRRSPTTGRSTTSSSSPTSTGPTASSASRGCRATPPIRPTPRTRRCRRCRSARLGSRWRARTTKLGWHWWPEFNSINSPPYDGRRPCVQRSTCQSGCNEGAKASTDLTHWPKAIALGARLVTGARVRRIETNEQGPRDRRDVDRHATASSTSSRRSVVVVAANAIGTPAAAAALGRRRGIRTAWRTRRGSSGSG